MAPESMTRLLRAGRSSRHRAAGGPLRLGAALLLVCSAGACREEGDRYAIDPAVIQRPLPAHDDPVDTLLARAGARVYRDRCVACHKLGPGLAVGPDLSGITLRRDPEWIRGMVLSPDSMLRTDSVARALLYVYQVPMIDPGIGEPEFRAVLEYLRAPDAAP